MIIQYLTASAIGRKNFTVNIGMNRRIVIIGDSWAAPPDPSQEIPGYYTREGHLAGRLEVLGWQIENYGIRGGSNLDSWRLMSRQRPAIRPQWVIWFHTELGRDWYREQSQPQPWYYDRKIEQVSIKVYKEIRQHYEALEAEGGLIVVEGHSQVQDPWFTVNFSVREIVRDWRSYLCRRKLPPSQIMGCMINNPDFLALCMDPLKQQLRWLADTELILEEMKANSGLFPDFAHPGDIAQAELAFRLHEIMK